MPALLVVEHNPVNLALLAGFLEREGFVVRRALTLADLDAALTDVRDLRLALIDVAGFDAGIWARCQVLNAQGVPFLVIAPQLGGDARAEGLAHGARSVFKKPLAQGQILATVRAIWGPTA